MGIIAVAGGTGDLGRTIVEQLISSEKHEVIVLTRKQPASVTPGARVVIIDYNNVDEMTATLDANNVDTVISTLNFGSAEVQLSLIAAADKATSTTRFIPSEFASYAPFDLTGSFTSDTRRVAEVLSKSGLQYTRFANGIFMDYFGAPNIPSTLKSFTWGVDIPKRRAAIPGTGDAVLATTYSKDVARFVERTLDDDGDWPEYSIISGSDVTFNQIVALAEKFTGHKFDVTYDSEEKLEKNEATVLSEEATYDNMDTQTIAAMLGLSLVRGEMTLPKEGRLNDKYPEVKPMTIEALMAQAWSTE